MDRWTQILGLIWALERLVRILSHDPEAIWTDTFRGYLKGARGLLDDGFTQAQLDESSGNILAVYDGSDGFADYAPPLNHDSQAGGNLAKDEITDFYSLRQQVYRCAKALRADGVKCDPGIEAATLCFLIKDDPPTSILLGYKKRGFGADKYAGFGGKVEKGETIQDATTREMYEETGVIVVPDALHYVGRLTFLFPYKPEWSQVVYVYLASEWLGEPAETGEMQPAWFEPDKIPYERMWSDSEYWLPPILAGRQVEAWFTFHADNQSVNQVEMQYPH